MHASTVETYSREIYSKKSIELGIVQTSVFNAPWLRQIVNNKSMLPRLASQSPCFPGPLSLQFRSVFRIDLCNFTLKNWYVLYICVICTTKHLSGLQKRASQQNLKNTTKRDWKLISFYWSSPLIVVTTSCTRSFREGSVLSRVCLSACPLLLEGGVGPHVIDYTCSVLLCPTR